ncbi:MAG: hypothetical protein JF614_21700 [Acidobacteria bacterium]|nr:hypothetical protein [Acidobacteriota bacterium]
MPGLSLRTRTRPFDTLWVTGALLGVVGLAAAGLEDVSFGHVHLVDGHVVHHHHFFLGPHEHPEANRPHDLDDDDDDDHDHHPEAPAHHHPDGSEPHHHQAPLKRTATVSAAPALFQPVGRGVLAAPLAYSTPVAPGSVAPIALQFTGSPTRPRGPPSPDASPDSLS